MATSSKEIIEYLEKKYSIQEHLAIKNCSDFNIESNVKLINQYVVGLTTNDKFGSGISQYEFQMKEKLANVTPYFQCLPWPFHDYELGELRSTLEELASYFQIDLDIDKMFKSGNIRKDSGDIYYVVITIVQYPIVYVE